MLPKVDCSRCHVTGFEPGNELFDPVLLPLAMKLDQVKGIEWRLHVHAGENPEAPSIYFVEVGLSLGDDGTLSFEGVADTDPGIAVKNAIDDAQEFMCA